MDRRDALKMLAFSGLAGPALSACSKLELFDTIAPRDSGAGRIAEGLSYGDHPRQKLDIYAPPSPHNAPVIVFFYGGSWNSGDRVDYGFLGTALAAQGFVTVLPDYRLVPEVRFPAFVQDGAAATAWVAREIGRFGGDGERIVVSGHSAGAYIASMVSLAPAYSDRAGSKARPRGFVGLAGPYDFFPFKYPTIIEAFGSWPRPEETLPLNQVHRGAPPSLLLHGLADTTVPPHDSMVMAERLKANGDEVELITYVGVDHVDVMLALSKPYRDRANSLADLTRFAMRVTA
jgi:acetyl esterase/lipase